MMFNVEHDRYVVKNKMLASAYDSDRPERGHPSSSPTERSKRESCFNCKQKRKCNQFNIKRNGSTTGVVSFGGTDDTLICKKYVPAPAQEKSISDKQIKSLMKNFRKSL